MVRTAKSTATATDRTTAYARDDDRAAVLMYGS
jgi:hypothetical protein